MLHDGKEKIVVLKHILTVKLTTTGTVCMCTGMVFICKYSVFFRLQPGYMAIFEQITEVFISFTVQLYLLKWNRNRTAVNHFWSHI